jgi:hypothetical protein
MSTEVYAAAGASSFRTKGLVYQGALEFWERAVPGGADAVRHALEDSGQGEVATLFGTRFVPGAWYPVLPILAGGVAAARVRRIPVAQHIRENAAWIAQRDLRGVYRVILTLTSVEAVAMRLGALSMRYFDFGAAETRRIRVGVVESERVGIPQALASWFVWCAEGFVPVALKMAGAESVEVRSSSPRPEGERHGVPTVRIRFEIEWT